MSYAGLGPRRKEAAPDETGNNPGNYTTQFAAADLAITVPWCELYRAVVVGAVAGSSADIYVGAFETSTVILGTKAEWDPAQPPLVQQGQDITFYWSIPVEGNAAPVTTLWFRYDAGMWSPL